jgi:hypothetical protein
VKYILLSIVVFFAIHINGQQTIAFQGFESTAQDNWNFTPPFQNNALPTVPVGPANYGPGYAKTGNFSCRIGGGSTTCSTGSSNCVNGSGSGGSCTNNLNGQEVEFAEVNVSGFTNIRISAAYRTHVFCAAVAGGIGFDASDRIFFEVQIDGGPWTTVSTLNGSNDCLWSYATNPVQCGANTSVANPFEYDVPECTNTIAFRVRLLINRSDEVLYVDDVRLTGETGGVVFNPILIQHIDN